MKSRVITISSEFGGGGRTIGEMVTKNSGIPCYDEKIIQKIGKKTGCFFLAVSHLFVFLFVMDKSQPKMV